MFHFSYRACSTQPNFHVNVGGEGREFESSQGLFLKIINYIFLTNVFSATHLYKKNYDIKSSMKNRPIKNIYMYISVTGYPLHKLLNCFSSFRNKTFYFY